MTGVSEDSFDSGESDASLKVSDELPVEVAGVGSMFELPFKITKFSRKVRSEAVSRDS